jgi:hypothetical protein
MRLAPTSSPEGRSPFLLLESDHRRNTSISSCTIQFSAASVPTQARFKARPHTGGVIHEAPTEAAMTDTPLTEARNRRQQRPARLRLINGGAAVSTPANDNEPQARDLAEPHP